MCGDVVFIHKQHGSYLSEWRRPRRQRQRQWHQYVLCTWNLSFYREIFLHAKYLSFDRYTIPGTSWAIKLICTWNAMHMAISHGNHTKKSRIKINSIWKTSEIYAQCIWNASFIPVLKSKNSRIENDITSVLKLLCVCIAMMRNRNKHNRNIVASPQCFSNVCKLETAMHTAYGQTELICKTIYENSW